MPRLVRISVTPLKSTALLDVDEVHLGPRGVADNRRFFMVDVRGRLISAVRHPEIVRIHATYDGEREHLTVALPGRSVVEGSAVADGERITVDFWGRPTPGRLVGGAWADALSSVVGEPVRLVRAEEDGGGSDDRPITLVSTASLSELARRAGREGVDPHRFRMLLELGGLEPHEEDTWRGRRVRIGRAVVRIGDPVPRCAVTRLDPATGSADLETLKVIAAYRGRGAARTLDFGVYADVEVPGSIAVGDRVVVPES